MAPPTGSRSGPGGAAGARTTRSSTGTSRGGSAHGGGIRKRAAGGPTRTDRDGDLVMGQIAVTKGDSKQPRRGVPGGNRLARPKAIVAAVDKITRHIGANDAKLSARVGGDSRKQGVGNNRRAFKILGLAQSAAKTNPDRGERALVDFIERKTNSQGNPVRIIKVCVDFRPTAWG